MKKQVAETFEESEMRKYKKPLTKVRKCRVCKEFLPPTNYFHCDPCKVKLELEEQED